MGIIASTTLRRRASVLVLAALAVLAWTAAVGPSWARGGPAADRHVSSARTPKTTPGRVIVKFHAGSTAASRRPVAAVAGARILHAVPARWLTGGASLAVVTSASESTGELMKRLHRDPAVAYVEPDATVRLAAIPDDPLWDDLWGMRAIRAPRAWDSVVGSPDIVVADLDTGVDYAHEDLAANMWHNPGEIPANGIDDDDNGYVDDVYGINATTGSGDPMDEQGHGTHTSGTVAAVGDNGIGVVGVAWNARIMALKFASQDPEGFVSDAVKCIDYILREKAAGVADVRVVNASWNLSDYSGALREAIVALGDAGVVFCAAAGNFSRDNDATPTYPANYDCGNIITVAATNQNDELAFFSCFGCSTVDLAAPGVDILSTLPGNQYAAWMGTSMATPCVAGAVALLAAQDRPGDTPERIKGRLMGTVVDLDLPLASGGRLDVADAVLAPTDMRGPRCGVNDATVTSGKLGRIWLRDYDVLSPKVTTTLHIAERAGSVRQRLRWENHGSVDQWWRTDFTCRLPKGAYQMWVTSTDFSGNRTTSAKAALRVK
jgi:subtilisin family serine protease